LYGSRLQADRLLLKEPPTKTGHDVNRFAREEEQVAIIIQDAIRGPLDLIKLNRRRLRVVNSITGKDKCAVTAYCGDGRGLKVLPQRAHVHYVKARIGE